jgi:hypothetical protein
LTGIRAIGRMGAWLGPPDVRAMMLKMPPRIPESKKPSRWDWAKLLDSRLILFGAGKRNRTPDLRITNALLYRLSYSGIREKRL